MRKKKQPRGAAFRSEKLRGCRYEQASHQSRLGLWLAWLGFWSSRRYGLALFVGAPLPSRPCVSWPSHTKAQRSSFCPLFAHVPGGAVLLTYGLSYVRHLRRRSGYSSPWFVRVRIIRIRHQQRQHPKQMSDRRLHSLLRLKAFDYVHLKHLPRRYLCHVCSGFRKRNASVTAGC